jgi:hypothetical protein
MNKPTDLSQLPLEELEKRAKTAKIAIAVMGVSILFMLLSGIFLTIKQGFNAFTILPVAFLPLLIVNTTSLKNIKTEIAKRQNP